MVPTGVENKTRNICNPCLNSGCVKEKHGSFLRINTMADRFGQVNKMIEHGL